MKKLKLNKKVIIDLSSSDMNNLRGGSDYLCSNFQTCNPAKCYPTETIPDKPDLPDPEPVSDICIDWNSVVQPLSCTC